MKALKNNSEEPGLSLILGLRRVTQGGFGGGGAYYTRKVDGKLKCYGGGGGGFSGGHTYFDGLSDYDDYDDEGNWVNSYPCDLVSGAEGESFSADPNAKFDFDQYEEYGYCKIEKLE